ncbi:MAG TPA: VapC toxin family PIN domain ribonuclease [Desulfobacteraceae bacterium]|nr:VapC toxin family PIN domain ribonuclease [Desulfobacteraceae bacterium]|tara:strand:- start:447 stop:794 length:348 start_codon:yes stop_codon:yes gene_type:complete
MAVIQKFKNMEVGQIAISSISVSELQHGVSKSKYREQNSKRLEEFLTPFQILPYDEQASQFYGGIRSQIENQGDIIGPLDLLIAAHALSRNLTLFTNNEKEFKRVPTLRIENWAN